MIIKFFFKIGVLILVNVLRAVGGFSKSVFLGLLFGAEIGFTFFKVDFDIVVVVAAGDKVCLTVAFLRDIALDDTVGIGRFKILFSFGEIYLYMACPPDAGFISLGDFLGSGK